MILRNLVEEINDLLIKLYQEGLDKEEKMRYENIPQKDLEDLKYKLEALDKGEAA
jgi:hypothetical protein